MRSSGEVKARNHIEHVAVFRMNFTTEKATRFDFFPGTGYKWGKGDVVVRSPKTIQLGDEITTRVRRAMHDAFARLDRSLNDNDYQIVQLYVKRFKKALWDNEVADPTLPIGEPSRKKLKYAAESEILGDFLGQVAGLSSGLKAENYQKQFLWNLLTPTPNSNIFDVTGWDFRTKQNSLSLHFDSNTKNEQLVFSFLQKAMDRKAETVMDHDMALRFHKEINDRFKVAFMKQYDPTRAGTYKGELRFDKIDRPTSELGLLPPLEELPNFVFDTNLNQRARDMLQSYLNGTYFMDPVEVLRMTLGLEGGSLAQLPSTQSINERVNYLWRGATDIKLGGSDGEWYKSKHTFRNDTYHSRNRFKEENVMDAFRKWNRECFGGVN